MTLRSSAFVRSGAPLKSSDGRTCCVQQSPPFKRGLGIGCLGADRPSLSRPAVPGISMMMLLPLDPGSAAPATTFDPVLNVPALGTFLFIAVVYSALLVRTNQVESAVQDRNRTLQALRALKSKELDGDVTVSAAQIEDGLRQYERAVRREEALRNVVPGGAVRIVPPSAGDAAEEEAGTIARQFLGQEFDIGVPKRERVGTGKLPTIAIAVLATLGLSLVGLLAFLTLDPMGAVSWIDNL